MYSSFIPHSWDLSVIKLLLLLSSLLSFAITYFHTDVNLRFNGGNKDHQSINLSLYRQVYSSYKMIVVGLIS